jgi:Rrf2 family protein
LAILALAKRYQDDRPLPIREIALAEKIPATFLTQILLKLKASGLVASTRGASGGYRLARAPEQISLIDVLQTIDGYSASAAERDGPSSPVLAEVWNQIRASEAEVLASTSIAALLERGDIPDWVI